MTHLPDKLLERSSSARKPTLVFGQCGQTFTRYQIIIDAIHDLRIQFSVGSVREPDPKKRALIRVIYLSTEFRHYIPSLDGGRSSAMTESRG